MKLLLTLTGAAMMLMSTQLYAIELLAMNDCTGDCDTKKVSDEMNPGSAVEKDTNSRAIAQSVDPNQKVLDMGVSPEQIQTLCGISQNGGTEDYGWGVGALFEQICYMEQYNYGGVSPDEGNKALKQFWEDKYSHVYCEINSAVNGTLDMVAIYHEKETWVKRLYSPEGSIKASNINRIAYLNFKLQRYGTLLDYLYDITDENPTYEVRQDPNYKKNLDSFKPILEGFGAKKSSAEQREQLASSAP